MLSNRNEETGGGRPRLLIIIASTRPGRVGLPVGQWVSGRAEGHGDFEVEVADLAAIALPMMDEPNHPRLRQYEHRHTKAWSARVEVADAFVFVMPEYNHGFTAPLKNAIDFLVHEWAHKPVGLVSYGGVAGGTRAVQMLKPVLTVLKLVPVPEGVIIPFVQGHLSVDRTFQANEAMDAAAIAMLDALGHWVSVLRPLRDQARTPA